MTKTLRDLFYLYIPKVRNDSVILPDCPFLGNLGEIYRIESKKRFVSVQLYFSRFPYRDRLSIQLKFRRTKSWRE